MIFGDVAPSHYGSKHFGFDFYGFAPEFDQACQSCTCQHFADQDGVRTCFDPQGCRRDLAERRARVPKSF
jgi:hypothetical protein